MWSSEPEASVRPSGEKATDRTQSEWPSRVCRSLPVVASQSLMVRSSEPEASVRPSGEKAIDSTRSEWPSRVCISALQEPSTCGSVCILVDRSPSNNFLIMLSLGENINAEQ